MIINSDIRRRRIVHLVWVTLGLGIAAGVNAKNDKEPKDGGQDNSPSDLFVYLIPPTVSIPSVGDELEEFDPVVETIAGVHFDVGIVVTDRDRQRVDFDGDLDLTWSVTNYLNPSQPPNQEVPQKEQGNTPIKNGLGTLHNVRYDECGIIQLTGLATTKSNQGKKKEDEPSIEAQNLIVISRPERFVLDTSAPIVHGNQPLHAQSTYPAGTPFTITIQAINAQNKVTRNYPYDDRPEALDNQLSITSEIVYWDKPGQNGQGNQGKKNTDSGDDEENEVPSGFLCSSNGNPWTTISRASFQHGLCEINTIAYSDAGIINVQVVDTAYMGGIVSGNMEHIGRFVPARFILTVDQPATNRSPEAVAPASKSAEYCYSGEPFSATVTIKAVNGLSPPLVTKDYQGVYDRSGGQPITVTVSPLKTTVGTLEVTEYIPAFSHGQAVVSLESLQFVFRALRAPESVSFHYAYTDFDGVLGESDGPAREFRCGRIRFLDCTGWSDESIPIEADVEWYTVNGWKLNTDEEHIVLSSTDVAIQNQTGAGSLQISGKPQTFFGGRLRGGNDALTLSASSVSNVVRFDLQLGNTSPLLFLQCLPGHWAIYAKGTPGSDRLSRGRILYEIEN